MNVFELVGDFADTLVRKLVILVLIGAALVGAYYWFTREPDAAEEMQRANPGWTVRAADGYPVRVDDASGRGDALIVPDDLGPYRIERIDCAEVRAAFPKWFALPDGPTGHCLRLYDKTPPTLVLNMRTPLSITQIWDGHFEPTIKRLGLRHGGGRSSGRSSSSIGYSINPPAGSDERTVKVAAWHRAGTTDLVFTFRQDPRH